MKIISSRNDIDAYISHDNPGGVLFGASLAEKLAIAIQDADHPEYGRDWGDWLGENINSLLEGL